MAITSFPNPVDEVSARLVATGVVLLVAVTLLFDVSWLPPVICAGFGLRVLAGPRFSPLALLATKVVRPRLSAPEKPVPGPPKRFAQFVGFLFTLAATLAWTVLGSHDVGTALMVGLGLAASLEAFAGFCLGCRMFAIGMRIGLVPEPVCERCATVGPV